uniref:caspase recruitment domain-containing protein 19-like isoform X4 n=1 Tax=Pristiophorus japonicus TaxID=55135 RepID=UPI00398F7744
MEGKSYKDALKHDRLFFTNEGGLSETLLNQIIVYLAKTDPPVLNNRELDMLRNPKMEKHNRSATLLDCLSRKGEESWSHFYRALKMYDLYLYQQIPSQRKTDIYVKKLKDDHLHFTNDGCISEEILLQVINELRYHEPPVLNRPEADKFLNDAHDLHLRVTDLLNALVNKGEEACGFFYAAYKELNPLGYMELPSTKKGGNAMSTFPLQLQK